MKTKRYIKILLSILAFSLLMTGCMTGVGTSSVSSSLSSSNSESGNVNLDTNTNTGENDNLTIIAPTEEGVLLTEGLSAARYDGDYGFDDFITAGGATSDAGVVEFLSRNILKELTGISFSLGGFGCSTVSVRNTEGDALFGRNFDWEQCNALIVTAKPTNGHASISTVNLDFLNGYSSVLEMLPAKAKTLAALYAPLDGMNDKGLSVAVLMINDSAVIEQNSDKPDVTTTTAVRLLLDKAKDVTEAIALLEGYDMHSSMGMMIHFAIADATGRSVVVEYVDNKMVVTETQVVTNFYIADGEKNGIGSTESHARFELLTEQLTQTPTMDMNTVRDSMNSVSKDNFGGFASTEWSIVYNQSKGEARYYHRENYENGFVFNLK